MRAKDKGGEGFKRVVLQIPTAGGKTRVGETVVRSALPKGKRCMWMAHRTELIEQPYRVFADLSPGCIAPSLSFPRRPDSPLQIASIQTLVAMLARGEPLPPADLIVVDECHHMGEGAGEWSKLLLFYAMAYVLGLTATPERGDGTGMAPMFERLIQVVSVRELTMAGHLVPCEVVRPGRYLRERGATGNKLAKDPVDAWLEHAGARSGFIFAASVEEAQEYAERLNGLGIVARCVHAKTPADERAAVVEGFRRGTVTVLTNVFVFTEGTDLPQASCCVLARGCSTAGMYLQIVGRVLRSAPGKSDALLVDLPGVSHLHGMPEDERVWRGRSRELGGGPALSRVRQAPGGLSLPVVRVRAGRRGCADDRDRGSERTHGQVRPHDRPGARAAPRDAGALAQGGRGQELQTWLRASQVAGRVRRGRPARDVGPSH